MIAIAIGILIAIGVLIAIGILIAIAIEIAIVIKGCLRDTLLIWVERNHVALISEVESRSFQSKYRKCS